MSRDFLAWLASDKLFLPLKRKALVAHLPREIARIQFPDAIAPDTCVAEIKEIGREANRHNAIEAEKETKKDERDHGVGSPMRNT